MTERKDFDEQVIDEYLLKVAKRYVSGIRLSELVKETKKEYEETESKEISAGLIIGRYQTLLKEGKLETNMWGPY